MLIQPDTYIIVLKGCPLDNTYEHTIYFSGATKEEAIDNQTKYFKGLKKYSFTKQSYQRYADGVLHIQAQAENLFDCNYIMFQNNAFGSKWFYAFITKVEYVNNVSCKVYYELDVMQTWFFDYELCHCFVEREHTETDNFGEHLVPEKLETGEYTYTPVTYSSDSPKITPFKSFSICILTSFDSEYNDASGGWYGKTYSGLIAHTFKNAGDANSFIDWAVSKQKGEGIVAAYMVPTVFEPGVPIKSTPGTYVGYLEKIKKNLTKIDGYTPRNKKLFTAPYNSLLVTNNDGSGTQYAYEYFYNYPTIVDNDYVALNVRCSRVNSPEYALIPWFYKGLEENHMERLVISGSPQCSYNTDTFKAWLAQNKVSLGLQSIGDLVGLLLGGLATAAGLSTANPLLTGAGTSTLASTFSNVTRNVGETIQKSGLPNQVKGNTNVGSLNINTGVFGFSIFYCTIRKEFAEIIDQYFDRYGYAVHQNKIPNRNVRPHWTFTKTVGCTLVGSLPSDVASSICAIYDRGITFWKKGSEIGDYSLDNKPT